MQICEHLWQVGGGDFSHPADAAAYLICHQGQAAIVDAGTGRGHDRLTSNIGQYLPANAVVKYLILTHCHFDHTGGAQALRGTFGCAIVAHADDAVFLEAGDSEVTAASWYGTRMAPLAVDFKLTGDRTPLELGGLTLTAHHWPGHSPGSMVIATKIDRQRIVFGQDVHGPIHPSLLSDEQLYQRSLQRLLELDADVLLEGHFGVIRGRPQVRAFIQSYLRADA